MEDAYSWLVPGVQIVERGRKIDEEKKEGKLERGKGREPLKVPSPSSQSPLVFPPSFSSRAILLVPHHLKTALYVLSERLKQASLQLSFTVGSK